MLRTACQISKTNIDHVMLRGNERKNIFSDDEDKIRFTDTLVKKRITVNHFN